MSELDLRLGDIMRGERVTKGKSLLDAQRETNIKATHIAALENADPDAFESPNLIEDNIRKYARYLKLDPEWAVTKFWDEAGVVVPKNQHHLKELPPYPFEENRLECGIQIVMGVLFLFSFVVILGYIFVIFLKVIIPQLEWEKYFAYEWVNALYFIVVLWIGYKLLLFSRFFDFLLILFIVVFVPVAFSGAYFIRATDCINNASLWVDYLYFSYITYTSVGYGDVVPSEGCRALAAFEGVVGIIGLGVVTSLFVIRLRSTS